MYTQWNQQNNAGGGCPFSFEYADQRTFLDPTYFPNNVPLTVYPEGLKGQISDEQICYLNGMLRGSLQARAGSGPAFTFLYNQLSTNNFLNDDYATLLMSLGEMVVNDRSPKAGQGDQLQFLIDLATMSMAALNINRYPQLGAVINPNEISRFNDMLRMASEITQQSTGALSSQPVRRNDLRSLPHHANVNRMANWNNGSAKPHGNLATGHSQYPAQTHHHSQYPAQTHHHPQHPAAMAQGQPSAAMFQPAPQATHQSNFHNAPQAMSTGADRFRNTHQSSTDAAFDRPSTQHVTTDPAPAQHPTNTPPKDTTKVGKVQEELVELFLDGELPEGTRTAVNGNGDNIYLYPASAVKHLPREFNTVITRDDSQRVTRMGQHPLCWAPSRESMFYTLTPNGTKVETLVQITEEKIMDIKDHTIPGAKVVWSTVNTVIVESDGKAITHGVDVSSTNMYCSAKSSSICNRLRMKVEGVDETCAGEYTYDDPEGFLVANRSAIMKLVSGNVERNANDNLADFAAAVNGCTAIQGPFKSALDAHCTAVMNEFVVYSLGVSVTVDSFLEDIEALLDRISSKEPEETYDALVNAEAELIRRMATVYTRQQMVKKGHDLTYDVAAEEGAGDAEKTIKALHDTLVLISAPVQVTELPWNFKDCDLDLQNGNVDCDIKPHGLVTAERMPEVLTALNAVYNRVDDNRTRAVVLVTQDGVKLGVHRSAYDDESYILVKI